MSDVHQDEAVVAEAVAEATEQAETATEIETPEVSELEAMTAERDEWKDKSYRLAAEMENIKRRTEREVSDARKYGVSKFAGELLNVQDNLERALLVLENSDIDQTAKEAMIEGMKMTSDQMVKAFTSINIQRIQSVGEKLNPELHQAVMQIPSEEEEGTIVQEMQAGYTIADRCLRPAMVGVAVKA